MFLKRSYQKEMMDDFSIDDERIDRALKELRIINKYLGGNSVTKEGLNKILSKNPGINHLKILDAGGGASDILLALDQNNLKIFSVDISKRITRYLINKSPEVKVVCADVMNLPFKEKQFDIVHLSLFLHHFNEEEIIRIITEIIKKVRHGIIINDLRRSVFALSGIKILTALFSKSDFVRNDGPLSVKKGFVKSELKKILEEMNLDYEIKYRWAFRWLLVIYI